MRRTFCMLMIVALTASLLGCEAAPAANDPAPSQSALHEESSTSASAPAGSTAATLPYDTESLIPMGNINEFVATRENVEAEMATALAEFGGDTELEYLPNESGETLFVYRMRNPHSQDIRLEIRVYSAEDVNKNLSMQLSGGVLTMPAGSPGGWHGSELYTMIRLFCAETKTEAELVIAGMDREWQALLDGDASFFEEYAWPMVYRGCQLEEFRPSDDPKDREDNNGTITLTQTGSPTASAQPDNLLPDGTRLPAPTVQELDLDQLGYDYFLLNRQSITYPSLVTATAVVDFSVSDTIFCYMADASGQKIRIANLPEGSPALEEGDVVNFTGLYLDVSALAFLGKDGVVYYTYMIELSCESLTVL